MPSKKASQKQKRGPAKEEQEEEEEEEEPEWIGDVIAEKADKDGGLRTHYGAVHLEHGMDVRVGDIVKIHSHEKFVDWVIARVDSLFRDEKGTKMFECHYFYQAIETHMAHRDKKSNNAGREIEVDQDPRRLFWATDSDNSNGYGTVFELNVIEGPVTVHWVPPGGVPPGPEVCDYWYDQEHSRNFMTFRDVSTIPDWQRRLQSNDAPPQPPAGPDSPSASETGDEASVSGRPWYHTIGEHWHFGPNTMQRAGRGARQQKVLNVLELCCGVGGLSFICQDGQVDDVSVKINPMWAVDFNQDAIATYRVNHPKTHAYCMGIDEFLMLAKIFAAELCARFPEGRPSSSKRGRVQVKVVDLRLRENASRAEEGQSKGQLNEHLTRDKCWLECSIQRFDETGAKGDACWIHMDELLAEGPAAEAALGELVDDWRAARRVPMQGDVHVVAGGPPCQGVSGLNRHTAKSDILVDPKNRLVCTYFATVQFFQPDYVLTEQVLDILKNEDGRYARYVLASLCALRYQCRIGVIAAGQHGVPQGRYRCFVWGAAQGVTLPSFPEPTHRVLDFNRALKTEAKPLYVGRLSDDPERRPHPMVLLSDVYTDLPDVHNFSMTEDAFYKCPPNNPFQRWIRRAPPAGTPDLAQRAYCADQIMVAKSLGYRKKLRDIAAKKGLVMVGRKFLCNNRLKVGKALVEKDAYEDEVKKSTAYVVETWNAHVDALCKEVEDPSRMRDAVELERAMTEAGLAVHLGSIVLAEVQKAEGVEAMRKASGSKDLVRDHRPLMCNADDWMRMTHVPRRKRGNFRHMPGVVQNADGTTCAGHCHILVENVDRPGFKPGCTAGGRTRPKKKGNGKDNRVENYDEDGWRGSSCPGCTATTHFLPSGDLVCKRWCVTYKKGKSNGRHGCFGRAWYDELQPTVVGRAEPHNLALLHAAQDRVVSVRENARCQGFPDYWVLCAYGAANSPMSRSGAKGIMSARYQQMGNAVAPPVAAALGRCLVVAVATDQAWAVDRPVIPVPDPDMEEAYAESRRLGQEFFSVLHDMTEEDGKRGCFKRKATAKPLTHAAAAATVRAAAGGAAATLAVDVAGPSLLAVDVAGPSRLAGQDEAPSSAEEESDSDSSDDEDSDASSTDEEEDAGGEVMGIEVGAEEECDEEVDDDDEEEDYDDEAEEEDDDEEDDDDDDDDDDEE